MAAVYFIAGLIAGLAIAWYYTKLHYESAAQSQRKRMEGEVNKNKEEDDFDNRFNVGADEDEHSEIL